MPTTLIMNDSVLLVVGSVHDKHLAHGKCAILEGGCFAKTVRISRQEFLTDFCNILRDRGIANLDGIVPSMTYLGRRILPTYQAIESCGGRIGGVILDQVAWAGVRHNRQLFAEVPIWMVTNDGRIGLWML